ncbi:MAG: type I 3-dehydroquinate dehydratase [Pseudomonadota bacterium]
MICVSISTAGFKSCMKSLRDAELAEIRLDKVGLSDEEINKLFSLPLKTIATCRPSALSSVKRMERLKKAIYAGAHYIDIELEASNSYKAELLRAARNHGCKVIISHHDNDKTPGRTCLKSIVDRCFDSGADIAKVACFSRSRADNARILSLYDDDRNIIALGLGSIGQFTRVAAILLGAPFTYASPAKGMETAAGQLDKKTLSKILENLKSV